MMRSEFDELWNEVCMREMRCWKPGPNEVEYKMIEKVYTFHPLFNVLTKRDAARLYFTGGAPLFRILLPKAEEVETLERQHHQLDIAFSEELKVVADLRDRGDYENAARHMMLADNLIDKRKACREILETAIREVC